MSISPMKILMFHSDKEERGKLAIMLARFDHCVAFSDGTALKGINFEDYDLFIVDEYLSEGSGLVLLQHLPEKVRAKTIFLTSGEEKSTALCQESSGIYDCMKKPVKPMELAVVACDFFVSEYLNEETLSPLSC